MKLVSCTFEMKKKEKMVDDLEASQSRQTFNDNSPDTFDAIPFLRKFSSTFHHLSF